MRKLWVIFLSIILFIVISLLVIGITSYRIYTNYSYTNSKSYRDSLKHTQIANSIAEMDTIAVKDLKKHLLRIRRFCDTLENPQSLYTNRLIAVDSLRNVCGDKSFIYVDNKDIFLHELNSYMSIVIDTLKYRTMRSTVEQITKSYKNKRDNLEYELQLINSGNYPYTFSEWYKWKSIAFWTNFFNRSLGASTHPDSLTSKLNFEDSTYLNKTYSLHSGIDKKATVIPFNQTESYKYFHAAFESMNSNYAYVNAPAYYEMGMKEFPYLRFANNNRDIQKLDTIIYGFEKLIYNYKPNIECITMNQICGAWLEKYGKELNVYKLLSDNPRTLFNTHSENQAAISTPKKNDNSVDTIINGTLYRLYKKENNSVDTISTDQLRSLLNSYAREYYPSISESLKDNIINSIVSSHSSHLEGNEGYDLSLMDTAIHKIYKKE